jgi:hypothetical protein
MTMAVLGSGWDGAELPDEAAVFGAEDGAVGSAGPGDPVADAVDASEAGGGVGVFDVPLRFGPGGQGKDGNNYGEAHEGRVSDELVVASTISGGVLHRYTPLYLKS